MLLAVSETTRAVDRAFFLVGGTCVLLLVGITIVMVMFAVRYRRSRSRTTSQVEGNTPLEIVWTVLPTLLVTWMFFVGYEGFSIIRGVPADAMVVQVTGKQWSWAFSYPDAGVDAFELVVPVDKAVRLEMTAPSNDVTHSFFIPDFRVKEDVIPGRTTQLWFKADRTGTFDIFCAEFCGKDHSQMLSRMRVVPADEYARWISAQQMKKYQPLVFEAVVDPDFETFGPAGLNIDARSLYLTFCASCHGIDGDGSGLPGLARDLRTTEAWKNGAGMEGIYRTLIDGIPNTQMRAFPNFTPWERIAMAHYVRRFQKTPLPPATREEYDALVKEFSLDKLQPPKPALPIDQAMKILVEEQQSSSTTPAP